MYFRSDPVKYCHHPTREEESSAFRSTQETSPSAAPACIKRGNVQQVLCGACAAQDAKQAVARAQAGARAHAQGRRDGRGEQQEGNGDRGGGRHQSLKILNLEQTSL